jgi:hypothetical protein
LLVVLVRVLALGGKRREIDAVGRQDPKEVVRVMDADNGRHHGARCRPDNDAGEQPLQEQGLDNTEMAEAKDGAALEHERRPPVPLPCVVDEIKLVLRRDGRRGHAALARAVAASSRLASIVHAATTTTTTAADLAILIFRHDHIGSGQLSILGVARQHGNLLDGLDILLDIFLYQTLGAGKAAIEQPVAGDVTQVADEAGAQRIQQAVDVAVLAGRLDQADALVDHAVVVVLARRVVAPHVQTKNEIEVLRGLGPVVVVGRGAQDVRPYLERGAAKDV